MRTGTYEPRSSLVFIITYPVMREIWAGAFRDRTVHHWEAKRFGPVLEDFIIRCGNNSMNCRKGYGSLRAVRTMEQMIIDFTENYTRNDCWIAGGDFANYFMSISKPLLWKFLERVVSDCYAGEDKDLLLYMMRVTLFHRCQDNYFSRSPKSYWEGLPRRKSLFYIDGLPIGNLPSQLWANFFGAMFMHWIMHIKGYDSFLLFVDDWRVLVRSAEEARKIIAEIRQWLAEELHITLHPNKIYLQHFTKGTKIVGAVVKPYRTYISNRTRGHFISTMRDINAEGIAAGHRGRISMLHKLRASVNSYLGMMAHFNSYKIRRRICEEMILPVWGEYVYFVKEYSRCKIKKKYDSTYILRRKLRSSKYAAKFIRPKYIPD